MAKFVILGNWTDQGIKNVKETTARATAAKERAAAMGGSLNLWWTMGRYDLVAIAEMPSAEAALGLLVGIGMQGNLHTETLPAWDAAEIDGVLQGM